VSAEQVSHWWGPANDNALLLSNHASPMTGMRLSRVNTDYYGPSWLRFIGPWNISAQMSKQKNSDQTPADNYFYGMRASSVPLPGLEIALSQTAQFSGSNVDTLTDIILGHNKIDNATGINQYNQLTSIDFKYSHKILNQSFAFYGEATGNKKNSLVADDQMFTTGFETYLGLNNKVIKTYLEYSDSTSYCTEKPNTEQISTQHCSYQHPLFSDGYQHKKQHLGASIGGQAKSITLATNYHQISGVGAFAKIRHIKQFSHNNELLTHTIKRLQLDLGYQQGIFDGLFKVSGSVAKVTTSLDNRSETQAQLQTSWEYRF
jgi:hypothetical protein